MDFEWDEAKNLSNRFRHGVRFENALEVFADPAELTSPAKTVPGETRSQTIGMVRNGVLLFVVHTARLGQEGSVAIRLISAPQASPKERRQYERR